jgi:hypothetical protein
MMFKFGQTAACRRVFGYPKSARQRNNALVASPCARATAETLFPGYSHSSTMASFSSFMKLRRLVRPSRPEPAIGSFVKLLSISGFLAALLALVLIFGRALGRRVACQSICTSPVSRRLHHRLRPCTDRPWRRPVHSFRTTSSLRHASPRTPEPPSNGCKWTVVCSSCGDARVVPHAEVRPLFAGLLRRQRLSANGRTSPP